MEGCTYTDEFQKIHDIVKSEVNKRKSYIQRSKRRKKKQFKRDYGSGSLV